MDLYAQTLKAQAAFSESPAAELGEWISAVDEVLSAAGECCIGRRGIVGFTMGKSTLWVHTLPERSGLSGEESWLPVWILKAKNPVLEARGWKVRRELEGSQREVAVLRGKLSKAEARVAGFEAEIRLLGDAGIEQR